MLAGNNTLWFRHSSRVHTDLKTHTYTHTHTKVFRVVIEWEPIRTRPLMTLVFLVIIGRGNFIQSILIQCLFCVICDWTLKLNLEIYFIWEHCSVHKKPKALEQNTDKGWRDSSFISYLLLYVRTKKSDKLHS